MRKLQILIVAFTLAAAVLGLGGCRRTDTTTVKQGLPLVGIENSSIPTPGVGGENSPLPTPGVGGENSPLPTPGIADSPVTP